MRVPCEVCGKTFVRAETGRPRMYCSDRCKERAKRARRKQDERNAVARLSEVRDEDEWQGAPLCHVCGRGAATRGTPVPLVCDECAAKGRDFA